MHYTWISKGLNDIFVAHSQTTCCFWSSSAEEYDTSTQSILLEPNTLDDVKPLKYLWFWNISSYRLMDFIKLSRKPIIQTKVGNEIWTLSLHMITSLSVQSIGTCSIKEQTYVQTVVYKQASKTLWKSASYMSCLFECPKWAN